MPFIDPRMFSGEPTEDITVQPASDLRGGMPAQTAPVPLESAFTGTPEAQAGAQANAQADRIRATMLESAGASFSIGTTMRIYDAFQMPSFPPESGFKVSAFLDQLPEALDESSFKYMKTARSTAEAQAKYELIKKLRTAQQATVDNQFVAFAAGLFDLVDFVTTPGVVKAGRMLRAGRVATGVAAGAAAAGTVALGEGPVNDSDYVLNFLGNFAGAAVMYKPGKGIVQTDPDFPAPRLQEAVQQAAEPTVKPKVRMTPEGTWEEVPAPLVRPHEFPESAVQDAVEQHINKANKGFDDAIGWNMAKTMRKAGPVGEEVSSILFDKVEPQRVAVRAELAALQQVWYDELLGAMAEDGYGLSSRTNPLTAKAAALHQRGIEKELQIELWRREQAARTGRTLDDPNVSPRIKRMADALYAVHAKPVHELKAAGVLGAEDLAVTPGWHHRIINSAHIEDMQRRLESLGLDATKAHQTIVRLFATSYRKANGLSEVMAYDIAAATVNRALRKGYFEDAAFTTAFAGAGDMKLMRDMLREGGLTGQRLERVMQFFEGKTDEAGKASFMKHRMEMDYKAATVINGQTFRVTDLLDSNISASVDQYLDDVSAQVAFARSGLRSASDVEKLRERLLHSIEDPVQRGEIKDLFDNVVASLRGLPTGEKVNKWMRLMGEYNRMITMSNSGIWQFTEYASIMGEYGVLKTVKQAIKEAPLFREVMSDIGKSKQAARQLQDVLTNHSEHNLRLRPFISRFEDNFTFDLGQTSHLVAQQAGQLIPYVNGMKYIHSHQARITANLIIDRLEQAAKGNAKAQQALQKYGIELSSMEKLKAAFKEHGKNIDAWPDGLWAQVRPAFGNMMDESVLHTRLKDMPAFAVFDKVGKFLTMYKSFIITSHNKLLVGRADRDGPGAVGLMMLYQMPLAAAAVQAQNTIAGKKELSESELAQKTVSQMGSLGLFADVFNLVTGNKSAGALPGTIPLDRSGRFLGSVADGEPNKALGNGLQLLPLVGAVPGVAGLARLAKED